MNKTKGKMLAKKTACALLSVSMLSSITACVPSDTDAVSVDPNRQQIYVGVTSEGLNEKWLSPVVTRFEQAYPQYQVIIEPMSLTDSSGLDTKIAMAKEDVYFLQSVTEARQMFTDGLLEDLTDVVTQGEPTIENGRTIESKIDEDFKEQYQFTKADGSIGYYGLPYAVMPYGITYDADLFEAKNLYNIPQYKGLDCIEGTADDNNGPDGKAGTFDDGLPATWEDFKVMMTVMRQKGITPFIWTGEHASYRTTFVRAIVAAYEGRDAFRMYYEMEGTDSFSGEEITVRNGYKLVGRPSQKAMLTAVNDIVSNTKNYAPESFKTSASHLVAQNTYILSERIGSPIAMLVEGAWWENEAKATFEEMAAEYGAEYGYGQRNFKYMPIPKFIGTEGVEDQTYMGTTVLQNSANTLVAINAASDMKEGAALFVRFTHTDESLKAFTQDNGMPRPFDYGWTDEEYASLSRFAKNMWELWTDENVEIVNMGTDNLVIRANSVYLDNMMYSGKLGSQAYGDPLKVFYSDTSMTVAKYVQAMAEKYSEAEWNRNMMFE